MCLRGSPPPVFLDGGRPGTSFLDDLVGWDLANRIRALFGYPPFLDYADHPFGPLCGGPDSYLACAFSSLWALGVFLLSFAAGAILSFEKKTAFAILGAGAVVSLLDTGIRCVGLFGRVSVPGDRIYADKMIEVLPVQLAANLLFQMLLPFAAALLLGRLGLAMRWSLGRIFKLL